MVSKGDFFSFFLWGTFQHRALNFDKQLKNFYITSATVFNNTGHSYDGLTTPFKTVNEVPEYRVVSEGHGFVTLS